MSVGGFLAGPLQTRAPRWDVTDGVGFSLQSRYLLRYLLAPLPARRNHLDGTINPYNHIGSEF